MGVNHLFNATTQARLEAPRQKKSPSLAARTTVNPYHKHATSKHSLFDALTFIVSEVVQDAQSVLYPFVQRARDTYLQPGYAYAQSFTSYRITRLGGVEACAVLVR